MPFWGEKFSLIVPASCLSSTDFSFRLRRACEPALIPVAQAAMGDVIGEQRKMGKSKRYIPVKDDKEFEERLGSLILDIDMANFHHRLHKNLWKSVTDYHRELNQ